MTHTISVHLSDAAQRAAILTGEPAHTPQIYDVPAELLARLLALPFTEIDASGNATCEVFAFAYVGYAGIVKGRGDSALRFCCEQRPADAEAAIAHVEARCAELLAKHAERRAACDAKAEVERAENERKEAERASTQSAALDVWERDHAAARAAGLPGSGNLRHFAEGHGDGYRVPEALRPRLAALRAAIQTEVDAENAAREATERAWVIEFAEANGRPELARAAREGRKLGDEPQEMIEDTLFSRVEDLGCAEDVINNWGGWQARDDVPSREAYALFDALTAAREQLGEGLPFPITIDPIARIDVEPVKTARYKTGVIVRCGKASVAALAEPFDDSEPLDEPLEE